MDKQKYEELRNDEDRWYYTPKPEQDVINKLLDTDDLLTEQDLQLLETIIN